MKFLFLEAVFDAPNNTAGLLNLAEPLFIYNAL